MEQPTQPPAAASRLPGSRREVLGLAWPIGVSMVSMTLKGVVDMLMVGRLGTEALAGVGLGNILAMNALAFGVGMLRGQKSLVSQHVGAGEPRTALSFGAHAFYLALMIGGVSLALSRVAGPLLVGLMAGSELSPASVHMASQYLTLRLDFGISMLVALAVGEYLRATGRPRLPMLCDLISHPLNVFFNWTLIYGHLGLPRLGVAGSALGTGLADTISLLLLLFVASKGYKLPKEREPYRFLPRRFLRLCSVGASTGVQFVLEVGSFSLITYLVAAHLGSTALAAHQACFSAMMLSFLPAVAIGDGGGVLVGRYVGRKDWSAVRQAQRSSISMALSFMSVMALLFVVFRHQIVRLYLRDEDPAVQEAARALGAQVLCVAAFWQIGDAFQIVYRFVLRATGDHRWVMWVGILCAWLLSAPLAWLAIQVLGGGLALVWILWSAEIYVGALVFWWRWRSGAWVRKRLVQDQAESSLTMGQLTE